MKNKNIIDTISTVLSLLLLTFSLFELLANLFDILDANIYFLFVPDLRYQQVINIFFYACWGIVALGYFTWKENSIWYDWSVVFILLLLATESSIDMLRDIPRSINIYAAIFGNFEGIIYFSFSLVIIYLKFIK